MKYRLITLVLLLLTFFGVDGKVRTAVSAQECAVDFLSRQVSLRMPNLEPSALRLVHEAKSEGNVADYYVFNINMGNGFVIVSGDDITQPVIAYSNSGEFVEETLPDNVRWWLSEYQRQLHYLQDHPDAKPRQEVKLSTSVPALMQTKWNQGKGFNKQCPTIPTSTHAYYDGKVCTGCVATAMAQIMKYHHWPTSGIGNHSYECDVKYGTNASPQSYSTTLNADFSQSTYNWNDMVNAFKYYTSDYLVYVEGTNGNDSPATAAQINSVSKLMSDVGISLDMMYGSYERGGSAAYVSKVEAALKTYFGYDNSLQYIDRDYYSGDVESMMRADLDARRPVLYSGSTANEGGHAFVIDGYDANGYYHVNWGWGGKSDGYYLLSLLSPSEQGAGSSEGGYNYRQLAVINIKPTESGKIALVTDIVLAENPVTSGSVKATAEVQAVWGDYSGDIQMWILNEKNEYAGFCLSSITLADGEKKTIQFQCPFTGQEGKTYYAALRNPYCTQYFERWGQAVPFTATPPAVLTSPTNETTVDFGVVNSGQTSQKEIYVKGAHLTSQLNLAISGNDYFTTNVTTLEAQNVNDGVSITLTYAPEYAGTHSAQLTISEGGLIEPVTVNLHGTAKGAAAPVVVDSMMTSLWTQSVPYRNACPIGTNGNITPPGCGAVALGQILNYHRVTNHGFGHASYDNLLDNETIFGSVDVNFDERVYDWANILDDYSKGYTTEQADAVADFLMQVGAGMKMMYRIGGSSPANDGSMLWGMHHYLHVSSQCMKHYRRNYTTAQWREMLNRELLNGRPVLYGGGSTSPLSDTIGYHIFVIDGVNDKGEYHVNFGQTRNKYWSAYLDLEVLNQSGQNSKPGGRGVCWQLSSYMMTDLMPVEDDDYVDNNMISMVVPVLNESVLNRDALIDRDNAFKLGYTLANYQYDAAHMEFGLGFYQDGMLKATSYGTVNPTGISNTPLSVNLGGGYVKSCNHYYRIPSTLCDGEYEMKFVCRLKGSNSSWLPVFEIAPSKMNVQVDGNQARVVMPENHQLATHLRLAKPVQVVETEFANFIPGTTLQHEFINPSEHNFQDTIRVDIMIDGQIVYSHKRVASVYEQCQTTYNILIPDSLCNLKGKQFTTESYYYEKMLSKYVKLNVGNTLKTADVNGDGNIDIADLNIIINTMLGKDPYHLSSSDLDKNGTTDIADVNIAINSMLGR